ncbi:Uracil phosphoribosyltransferase, partial [human gut metagenome]
RIGIIPNFLPAIRLPVILVSGVSTSTSSSGKLRVISYPINIVISSSSSLKSLEPVCTSRINVTLKPVEYYCKLPSDVGERDFIVTDPMLAPGGGAAAAITLLKEKGAKHIKLMC